MIRLDQQRHLPRHRLIGEQGREWLRQIGHGAGLVLFLIAAIAIPQHAADIMAWLRTIRIGLVAGDHLMMLVR